MDNNNNNNNERDWEIWGESHNMSKIRGISSNMLRNIFYYK